MYIIEHEAKAKYKCIKSVLAAKRLSMNEKSSGTRGS